MREGGGAAGLSTRRARERGLSPFAVPLARLLRSTGHVPAERALLEEAHGARRDALGWRHADTRLAFDNLVELLRAQCRLCMHARRTTAALRAFFARVAACAFCSTRAVIRPLSLLSAWRGVAQRRLHCLPSALLRLH